jgi:hypothetical protein
MARERADVEKNFRYILIPVVYAWIIFACVVIAFGLTDETVIDNLEGYLALLAILSAPATLAISEINRLYAQHQENVIMMAPEIEKHSMKLESDTLKHHNVMDSAERMAKIKGDENE